MKRGRHGADEPTRATPPTGPLAYLEVLFGTMAAATTGLLYSGFFTSRDYLPPLLVAAAGAALLAVLTAVRRWRASGTLLVAVLGFALIAVFLVYRHTLDHGIPTVKTATDLGTGLLHGWARMLSVGLPADVTQDLLITPVLLTFVATFVSTTLSVRTRAILAPALPTLLALVIGLLFTAARPAAGAVVTAAYLVVTLLLIVVRVSRLETAVTPDTEVVSAGPVRRRAATPMPFRHRCRHELGRTAERWCSARAPTNTWTCLSVVRQRPRQRRTGAARRAGRRRRRAGSRPRRRASGRPTGP